MPTDPSDNSKPSKSKPSKNARQSGNAGPAGTAGSSGNARSSGNAGPSGNQSSANEMSPVAAKVGVAILGVLLLVLGLLAGYAVWGLLTGREVLVSGWIYIICFVFAAIGFVPMVRQMRRAPQQD